MNNTRCVPLAIVLAFGAAVACERPSAAAPEYEDVSGRGALALCSVASERVYAATVGAAGARFSAPGVFAEIPAGALADDTHFIIRIPATAYAEIEVTANGQQHFEFLRPVTLGIDYGRCGRAVAGDVTIWHIDPVTKAFLEDMGGVNDVATQRVVFSTTHLSGYAIAN